MSFTLHPALHLDRGRLREAPDEPAADFIAATARRFEEAVVVDVVGLARNQPDVETIKNAAAHRLVWADTGPRTTEDVMDVFIAGATRVTARWMTLRDGDELQDAADVCEALYLGVEVQDGQLLQNPRTRADPDMLDDLLAGHNVGVVVIDLDAKGTPTEGALRVAKAFTNHASRWYMGAITADAARSLEAQGFDGAVVPLDALENEPRGEAP